MPIHPSKAHAKRPQFKIIHVSLPKNPGEKFITINVKRLDNNFYKASLKLQFSSEVSTKTISHSISLQEHAIDKNLLEATFTIDDNLKNIFYKPISILNHSLEGIPVTLDIVIVTHMSLEVFSKPQNYTFTVPRPLTIALMGDSYAAGLGTGAYDLSKADTEPGAFRSSVSGAQRFVKRISEEYRVLHIDTSYAGGQLFAGNEKKYLGSDLEVLDTWQVEHTDWINDDVKHDILVLSRELRENSLPRDILISKVLMIKASCNTIHIKTHKALNILISMLHNQVSSIIAYNNSTSNNQIIIDGSQLRAVSYWLTHRSIEPKTLDYMILSMGGNDMYEYKNGASGLTLLIERVLFNAKKLNTKDYERIQQGHDTFIKALNDFKLHLSEHPLYQDTKVIMSTYPDLTKNNSGTYTSYSTASRYELETVYEEVLKPLNDTIIDFCNTPNNLNFTVNNLEKRNPKIIYYGLTSTHSWFNDFSDVDTKESREFILSLLEGFFIPDRITNLLIDYINGLIISDKNYQDAGLSAAFHPNAIGQYEIYYKTLLQTFNELQIQLNQKEIKHIQVPLAPELLDTLL